MKKSVMVSGWGVAVSAALAATLIWAPFVAALLRGRPCLLTSSEAAAWVQAIGSVAAIAVAIWTVRAQGIQQARRERERDAAAVGLRAQLATAFHEVLNEYLVLQRQGLEDPSTDAALRRIGVARRLIDRAVEGLAALRSFPVHMLIHVDEFKFLDAIRQKSALALELMAQSAGNPLDTHALKSVESAATQAQISSAAWQRLASQMLADN